MNAFLRSTSIRQRLLGSLLALCVMILGMGGWAAMSFRGLQQHAAELLDSQAQGLRATGDLLASLERVHSLAQAVLLNGNNPVEAGEILGQWQKASASTLAQLKSAGEGASHPALSDALAGFTAYSTAVGEVLPKVAAATLDGAAGFAYVGQAQADFDKSREGVRLWSDAVLADIVARREADRTAEALQSNLRLATVIVALGLFCALMLAIVRSISGPLEQARHSAQRIAQGDLSVDIHSQGRDEVAQFMTTLAEMQASLRRIVGQVRNSADSIRVASDEVASGNLDLSQRTEQAASNLQETAASMETLTGTVRHSAEAAGQANSLASEASAVAERGGERVGQVVQTMDQINTASRKIGDITGVIDGIAFQTNILALNAAVEAARAGEQGRGFAVVAAEVRSLAQRSAEAAREIKSLIGASVEQVESGTRQVRDAGQTMDELVSSVRQVSHIIGEISDAAGAQSRGIGEVGASVNQLDTMTQQNAALVEESAAAAESLKQQARQLTEVVATFRLEADPSAAGFDRH